LHDSVPTPLTQAHQQKLYRDGLERRLAEFCRPVVEAHAALHTRGRTNLRDVLLSSTAEKALEESKCSILAVTPGGFHHPLASDEQPRTMQMKPTS